MANVREWAQLGAARRAAEIQAELAAIQKAFPDIGSRRRVQEGGGGGLLLPEGKRKRRGRPPMSEAQKRAVSIRMKKYWAGRRKEKG